MGWQDLHDVTPDIFLEMAGGVLHSLSYQQVQANAAQQLVCVLRLSYPNCLSVPSACGTVCRDHLHVLCFLRQQIWQGHHNMRLLKTPAKGLCTLHGCRRATCRCQQAQSTSQKAASCSSAPRCILLLPSQPRGWLLRLHKHSLLRHGPEALTADALAEYRHAPCSRVH